MHGCSGDLSSRQPCVRKYRIAPRTLHDEGARSPTSRLRHVGPAVVLPVRRSVADRRRGADVAAGLPGRLLARVEHAGGAVADVAPHAHRPWPRRDHVREHPGEHDGAGRKSLAAPCHVLQHVRMAGFLPADSIAADMPGLGSAPRRVVTQTGDLSGDRCRPTRSVHPSARGLSLSAGSTACVLRAPVFGWLLVTAEDAAEELTNAQSDLAVATAHAEHLQRALVSNREIGMAMGILMERHRLTQEQAFERLRDLSQRSTVKLRDVAEQIIHTGDTQQRPG